MSGGGENSLPIGLDDPNSIAAYLQLQRKAALVQALQQDSLTPVSVQQPQGGGKYYQAARVGPIAALSKLAEALIAKKGYGDVVKGEAAQRQAELAAFGGGPSSVAPPPTPGGGAQDAGQPGSAQPFNPGVPQQRTTPYNPGGLPPSAALALAHSDPKAYVEYLRGDPDWRMAMKAAEGDPDVRSGKQTQEQVASRLLYGKARVAAQAEARSGQLQRDYFTGSEDVAPNTTENMTYIRGPNGTLVAQPIGNAADIVANAAGKKEAATEAEKPHEYKGEHGETGFAFVNPPHVGSLTAPTTPPLKSLGQAGPQPPIAAPGPSGVAPAANPPYKPKLPPAAPPPTAGGGTISKAGTIPGSQTTAQNAAQAAGGKDAAEYLSNLAQDSNGALEVHRQLDEMKRLSIGNRLNASAPMKMHIGQMAIAAGVDPEVVAKWTGIEVGKLEAAAKETSSLAVASIHQMTSRGTNFDLSTFMKNNPNFAMTPEGFYRVVDYMDRKSLNIIAKHADAVKYHEDNPNMSPDVFMSKHTAKWNQDQVKAIDAGKAASRPPPDRFRLQPTG